MNERNILSKGDIVELINKREPTLKRTFEIVKKIDDGAFSICYDAFYGDSGHGVLKEFYPEKNNAFLERNKDNQLVISDINEYPDQVEAFEEGAQKYIEPYEKLITFYQDSEDNDLQKFIPSFEIYYGYSESENKNGTVYLWTDKYKTDETFNQICDEIHKYPDKNPERNLAKVLCAIYTLTKCIRVLHQEGFVHRDIKPTNFGFVKLDDETLTQNISLFDINTICPLNQRNCSGSFFSEGFSEPELKKGEPVNNQTDIYSIGATLFYAIVVTEEIREPAVDENDEDFKKPFLYYDSYYDRLPALVKDSELIKASESNSYYKLVDCLTDILQKCLCGRENRYENCEQLLEDLENAIQYISPMHLNIESKRYFRERWALIEKEKSFDQNKEKNSTLAIQYHLYEHPLYQCVHEDEEAINVLLIGFGNYGQKFLDACLQVGQMRNKHLCVTVVSDDVKNEKSKDNKEKGSDEIYLENRPELKEFFNVDNSLKDRIDKKELELSDVYGDITFVNNQLNRNNENDLRESIKQIMRDQIGDQSNSDTQQHPHYIFIALGEDALNRTAGDVCREEAEKFKQDMLINYVQEYKSNKDVIVLYNNVFPLYVNVDIRKSPLYKEVERMAFNTHLVWNKEHNINYRVLKKEFSKRYNHDSCVGNVLSLKYKLNDIGIDLEKCGFDEAAHDFKIRITNEKNDNLRDVLIWIEHRRWVVEKLCLGWRTKSVEQCGDFETKDNVHKKHVCIVRSNPKQVLSVDKKWMNNKKWDTASEDDIEQLDQLDRMSIELHQFFIKCAEQEKLILRDVRERIEPLIKDEKETFSAFREWLSCMTDIYHHKREKVFQYEGLMKTLEKLVNDKFDADQKETIKDRIKILDKEFKPILESMRYRDWKQDDVALIDYIPFILTYSENIQLIIPYAKGSNTNLFGNVAVPTLVNPKNIFYIYQINAEKDLHDLKESVMGVVKYLKKKEIRSKIEFVLVIGNGLGGNNVIQNKQTEILNLGEGLIKRFKLIYKSKQKNWVDELRSYFEEKIRRNSKSLYMAEINTTNFSSLLCSERFYESLPHYVFDSKHMKFESLVNCELLGYIPKTEFITFNEMMTLAKVYSEGGSQPEFFENYRKLWRKYCENTDLWKNFCKKMKEYFNNDFIVSFGERQQRRDEPETYEYFLSSKCYISVKKILDCLKSRSIAENESSLLEYNTELCKVKIIDKFENKDKYDELFDSEYSESKLMDPEKITICDMGQSVKIKYDTLFVRDVKLDPDEIGLVQYFSDEHYLKGLNINENDETVSFRFISSQAKDLLATEGRILEIYIYHSAKDSGTFNDIVCSCEIERGGKEPEVELLKNEFDCILTKGFQSCFIECKARPDIDENFFYKISSLTRVFGINSTIVFIADTEVAEEKESIARKNQKTRERGEELGIITIWKKNDIKNINKILQKIIS